MSPQCEACTWKQFSSCERIQDLQGVSGKQCVGQILESPKREENLSVDLSRIGWPHGLVGRGLS